MAKRPDIERITRLPNWAQDYISGLERELTSLRRDLGTACGRHGKTPVRVNLNVVDNTYLYVPPYVATEWVFGPGRTVEARLDRDGKTVRVSGSRTLVARPYVSNVMTITTEDKW